MSKSCTKSVLIVLSSLWFPDVSPRDWMYKEVSCLTRRSWCRPPWGGFRTVWWACRLAGGPRRHTSLRDVPLARPGASASPPNPLGEEQTEKSHMVKHVSCRSMSLCWRIHTNAVGMTGRWRHCINFSRWQQRVKSSWSAGRLVKPGSGCASVDLCACAPAG